MAPYRQGRIAAADAFKLSSNENPYGPLPAVVAAIAASSVNRYPDAAATELRTRLAEKFELAPTNVQVGAGSVSIIAQLISAAAAAGDEVIYSWRSFEAYPGLVAVAGASSVQIPNRPDHGHDLGAMAKAITDRTRLILVCSPNNPTGSIVTKSEFATFMSAVPPNTLVVLDEAYAEFITDPDAVQGADLLGTYPNLVVLRTFSKAYGLAGLRIGYALGSDYLMDAARATAMPLSVIEPAQRAAIASLDHEAELLDRVREISVRRDEVWAALQAQGWDIPRPHGNFLWFPTGVATAKAYDTFERHGIVARALPPDGLRITVGEAESVEKLLKASAEVVGKLRTAPSRATLD
jgi:histidinol-phosphate aminotransferase